jgi:NADH dehydrogenase
MSPPPPSPSLPRVVIIGGGFAGLAAARALGSAPAHVLLVDRKNHHVFQPLLYQVATAALSPAEIAAPIRHVLRRQRNCSVVLGEITRIDPAARTLHYDAGPDRPEGTVPFDYLVLAAGATHSYFGHPEWQRVAPGLKTLEDATAIRQRILLAFESAEYEGDAAARRAALTFAIVGGGPTGVELAGAIMEIAAKTIPSDFRFIDTTTTKVILFEGGPRLLESFPPELSARAERDLRAMGVDVRLSTRVTGVSPQGLTAGGAFVPVRNVLWAAGVMGAPVARTLGVSLDRAGRIPVAPDLSIPGHPRLFVAGDLAAATCARTNKPVPGVAQGAMQMGRHAGQTIAAEIAAAHKHRPAPARPAFTYRDKGSMATIGRARAVAQIGRFKFAGFVAWALWALIHVMFIINFRSRLVVLLSWAWNYIIFSRDARLIIGDARLDIATPRAADPPGTP